jgi:hypothetical protein
MNNFRCEPSAALLGDLNMLRLLAQADGLPERVGEARRLVVTGLLDQRSAAGPPRRETWAALPPPHRLVGVG